MTKRDYIRIAEVLNANEAPVEIVLDFTDMLEEDNPRFDRALFIDASTEKLRDSWERAPRSLSLAKRPRRK